MAHFLIRIFLTKALACDSYQFVSAKHSRLADTSLRLILTICMLGLVGIAVVDSLLVLSDMLGGSQIFVDASEGLFV